MKNSELQTLQIMQAFQRLTVSALCFGPGHNSSKHIAKGTGLDA